MPDSNILRNSLYTESLYPLQNKILNALRESSPCLYLTGGTALSRFYFHHRYSDDLDLFTNGNKDFASVIESATKAVMNIPGITVKNSKNSIGTDYLRLNISQDNTNLAIDFVNDIDYRLGKPITKNGFRIDSLENILTNKISAIIGRDEIKDIVDLRAFCRKCSFNWDKVIEASAKKEASVSSELIDYRLSSAIEFLNKHPETLNQIVWIKRPKTERFKLDLQRIRKDILKEQINSLSQDNPNVIVLKGLEKKSKSSHCDD